MIWLGRLISVPLGLILFVLLLATLVILEVDRTFLNPGYYPEQLRKANFFEFVLGDLLTSGIDEARAQSGDDVAGVDKNLVANSGLTTEDIVSSVNSAVPPEWVQGLVEQSFDQFGRYLTGERDEFQITVKAGDRATALVEEVKSLLRKANAYDLLYEEAVNPAVEQGVNFDLPLGVELTSDRLLEAIRTVAPSQWVQSQVERVLDEVTPYFTGGRDSFAVTLELEDRVPIALEEVKQLLREADAYDLLYTEVVEPQVAEKLGDSAALPFGVAVSTDEVLGALRQVAPVEWVQQQVETLIDDVGPYLAGQSDTFSSEISLLDNKRQARGVIADLVGTRLTQVVEKIPKCQSTAELAAAATNRDSLGLPSCVPANIPVNQLLRRLDVDVGGVVSQFVLGPLPDEITFDEERLRQALSLAGAGENIDRLDEVRDILGGNWSYTDVDLRQLISEKRGEGDVERLDDLRAFLGDGWTYTDADFRADLLAGRCVFVIVCELTLDADDLDTGRDAFSSARTFKLVIYIPLLLLLVVIAFLGGRNWSGRVAYGAAFLVVSAGIIYVAFGPVYGAFVGSAFDEVRKEAVQEIGRSGPDFPQTARLASTKGIDMGQSVVDGFASGISGSSLSLTVLGLLLFGGAVFWSTIISTVDRFFPNKEKALKG